MSTYSSAPGEHRSMVFDAGRNRAYFKAITQAVNAGSVVMDLGAGLGVHGLFAAKLGAKKVYLIEPSPVIELARQLAKANALANVEAIQTTAERLDIAEKMDVIISVFTGNFLLTEDLLPSLFLARDKFLAPGGKMIPDQARMMVAPVSAPKYHKKHIDIWSSEADQIDHDVIRPYAANTLYYDSAASFDAAFLADPSVLLMLDFMTANTADCDCQIEVSIDQDAICHGWLGWFDMRLGKETFSTSPKADESHWSQVFLPLDPPIKLHQGDRVSFELQRPERGEWTWTTIAGDHQQRHSTFLSEPLSPGAVLKKSDRYAPLITGKGEIVRQALSLFDGETPVSDIATQLLKDWPDEFSDVKQARRYIDKIIKLLD